MKKLKTLLKLLASRDPLTRFELLHFIGRRLVPNYRFLWPQIEWWNDPQFNAYLKRFGEFDGMNSDRRWMLSQLMRLVATVPGDTAECGVFKGAGSWVMCKANRDHNAMARTHHVFDSFEGLSAPAEEDGNYWHAGALSCGLDSTAANLAEFGDRVVFHQGWIPDRFADVSELQFAFVHIDVDLYQPTRDSVEFFYPRMPAGGIILCDDYGFGTCPGARQAMDEFFSDKPEKVISLPGGGGFILKGVPTVA